MNLLRVLAGIVVLTAVLMVALYALADWVADWLLRER